MRTNRYELTKSKKKKPKQEPVDPADLDALLDARQEQPAPEQPPQQQVLG